jgi:hypothetical protein
LRQIALIHAAKADFNPDEPRIPKGGPHAGEWTTGDGEGAGQPETSPDDPNGNASSTSLIPVAYQGHYHDQLVETLRQITVQGGGAAVTQVPLTARNGVTAVADLIVDIPGKGNFIVEVKIGENPQYTPSQRAIYAMAPIGGHLTSSKAAIAVVGLKSGEPLPPLPVLVYWAPGPGRPVRRWFVTPEFLP